MTDKNNSGYIYYINSNHFREGIIFSETPLSFDLIQHISARKTEKYTTGTFLGHYTLWLSNMLRDTFVPSTFNFIDDKSYRILNNLVYKELYNITWEQALCFAIADKIPEKIISKREKLVLNGYIDFIEMCAEHREHCNMEALKNLCVIMHEPLIRGFTIPKNLGFGGEFLGGIEKDKLHTALENYYKENDERLKLMKGDMGRAFPKNVRNKILRDKSKMHYLNVYEIASIKDILLASLQEIFNEKRVINKCSFCNRIFVPNARADTKYCDYPSNNNGVQKSDKTCKELAILENRRNHYNNDEILRYYKRIRTKLYNRIEFGKLEATDDEAKAKAKNQYNNFIDTYYDLNEGMKQAKDISQEKGYAAEKRLLEWLKEQDIATSRKKK